MPFLKSSDICGFQVAICISLSLASSEDVRGSFLAENIYKQLR